MHWGFERLCASRTATSTASPKMGCLCVAASGLGLAWALGGCLWLRALRLPPWALPTCPMPLCGVCHMPVPPPSRTARHPRPGSSTGIQIASAAVQDLPNTEGLCTQRKDSHSMEGPRGQARRPQRRPARARQRLRWQRLPWQVVMLAFGAALPAPAALRSPHASGSAVRWESAAPEPGRCTPGSPSCSGRCTRRGRGIYRQRPR